MKKNLLQFLLPLLVIANEEEKQNTNTGAFEPPQKETEEERTERLEAAQIKNFEKQGLKKFNYNGRFVWALNQKNADRKAKSEGLL